MTELVVRDYGTGSSVAVLHGGPGAPGDAGALATALGARWHVVEPFQRPSGGPSLTVATHVEDLDDVIRERCGGRRPVIIGHSWGAMLALAYGAAHPGAAAGLALVGCGTFSTRTRAAFEARLEARLTPQDRADLGRIRERETDPDRRLEAMAAVMARAYSCDPDEDTSADVVVDARAHDETWNDMLRLQREGVYPAAFAAIGVPVLMVHGADDPHPGRAIFEELRPHLPQLEYRELPRCGHWPWRERQARRAFFDALGTWIAERFRAPSPPDLLRPPPPPPAPGAGDVTRGEFPWLVARPMGRNAECCITLFVATGDPLTLSLHPSKGTSRCRRLSQSCPCRSTATSPTATMAWPKCSTGTSTRETSRSTWEGRTP